MIGSLAKREGQRITEHALPSGTREKDFGIRDKALTENCGDFAGLDKLV
jgi:hypothetical protein